jgi:hypothetical protein
LAGLFLPIIYGNTLYLAKSYTFFADLCNSGLLQDPIFYFIWTNFVNLVILKF